MPYYRLTNRRDRKNVLVFTGGHPFDGPDFFSLLDQIIYDGLGMTYTHVEQPAALAFIENPELTKPYEMILFYDVPGQDYQFPGRPIPFQPSEAYKAGFERLLEEGKPMLFLHHAIVGWSEWLRYSEVVGGCLMTAPGKVRGKDVADSGARYDITHKVYPVAKHPVTEGLEDGFTVTDQLYMLEVFDDLITPLMRSDYPFTSKSFYSVAAALQGKANWNEGWDRPDGDNAMVWFRREKKSPIIYTMCGDGRSAYEAPGFRKLLGNAIRWLSSEDAKA